MDKPHTLQLFLFFARPLVEWPLGLADAPGTVLNVAGVGPSAAVQLLKLSMPKDALERQKWLDSARVAAIMGSCPKSKQSFVSGTYPQHDSLWRVGDSKWLPLVYDRLEALDQLHRDRLR